MPRPDDHDPAAHTMSFGDHLEELRRRVLLALAAPLPLAIAIFIFSERLIALLYRPLDRVLRAHDLPRVLQALTPTESLGVQIKLSLIFAAVLAAPWMFWQLWLFIRPGLYRHEQRFVYFLLPLSTVLTAAGLALMYFVMLPLMLHVLVLVGTGIDLRPASGLSEEQMQALIERNTPVELRLASPSEPQPWQTWMILPDQSLHVAVPRADGSGGIDIALVSAPMVSQQYRLSWYINFVLLLLLAIVIAFQMPLVVLLLGWLGLVSADWLRSKRRYALMVCAIVAAAITPTDGLSMILMAIPLYALYEFGILLLVFAPARKIAAGTVVSPRRAEHAVPREEHDRARDERDGGGE